MVDGKDLLARKAEAISNGLPSVGAQTEEAGKGDRKNFRRPIHFRHFSMEIRLLQQAPKSNAQTPDKLQPPNSKPQSNSKGFDEFIHPTNARLSAGGATRCGVPKHRCPAKCQEPYVRYSPEC